MKTKILSILLGVFSTPAFAQYFPIPAGAIPFGNSRRTMSANATSLLWDNTDTQLTLSGVSGASKPVYSFADAGADDNGMYYIGTDIFGFATAGTEQMRVDTTGVRVGLTGAGIGTTEKLSARLTETGGGGSSYIATTSELRLNADAAYSTAGNLSAIMGRLLRTETASQTDTADMGAFTAQVSFNPSAAQTITNATTNGVFGFRTSGPTNAGAGALAITHFSHFYAPASSLNTGTNKYGVRIGNQTGATNNYAISTGSGMVQIGGSISTTPAAVVNLTADGQAVTVGDTSFLRLSSNDGTPANRTFTLSNGLLDGHVLRIHLVAQAAELADSGNVALSAAWQPDANDTLSLQWDATNTVWRELGRSAN